MCLCEYNGRKYLEFECYVYARCRSALSTTRLEAEACPLIDPPMFSDHNELVWCKCRANMQATSNFPKHLRTIVQRQIVHRPKFKSIFEDFIQYASQRLLHSSSRHHVLDMGSGQHGEFMKRSHTIPFLTSFSTKRFLKSAEKSHGRRLA